MGERLSRGVRIHNRKEKSLARKQGRRPDLIRRALPIKKEKPTVLEQPQMPQFSPSFMPMTELPVPTRKQRKQPTDMSFMEAGMTLSIGARQRIKPGDEESHENLSDQQAVTVLENLEDGIRSGKILSQTEIARQALRLGSKMGMMGSVTTEIDVAAWRVLDAIQEKRNKLTK